MRRTTRCALAGLTAFLLAACGSDDGDAAGSDETAETGDDGGAAAGDDGGGDGATIVIDDFSFGEPATVATGATVTVVNEDGATHTYTSSGDGTGGEVFDVELAGGGQEASFTVNEAGTYDVVCRIHSSMQGTLTVEG